MKAYTENSTYCCTYLISKTISAMQTFAKGHADVDLHRWTPFDENLNRY